MRVTKNDKNEFVIDDAPMSLEGEAATDFVAQMKARNDAGPDSMRDRFREQCVSEYRKPRGRCRRPHRARASDHAWLRFTYVQPRER